MHLRGTCGLVVVLVACGAPSDPIVSATAPTTDVLAELERRNHELRERCSRHEGDRERCVADVACAPGPPIVGCDGEVCTDGGPMSCLACLERVELRDGPIDAEVCALRAAGRLDEARRRLAERSHTEP